MVVDRDGNTLVVGDMVRVVAGKHYVFTCDGSEGVITRFNECGRMVVNWFKLTGLSNPTPANFKVNPRDVVKDKCFGKDWDDVCAKVDTIKMEV